MMENGFTLGILITRILLLTVIMYVKKRIVNGRPGFVERMGGVRVTILDQPISTLCVCYGTVLHNTYALQGTRRFCFGGWRRR